MKRDMTNEIIPPSTQQGEIILYQPDETVRLEVRLEDETVWLTQAQIVELFEKDQSVIARHIGNIFREGELEEVSNMQILHNTLSKYKPTKVYSLRIRSGGFAWMGIDSRSLLYGLDHVQQVCKLNNELRE